MKRFACQDVIPGCDQVFTGADDQSVLDQVIAHAAMDHGLVKPPLALVELVVATTHTFVPVRGRGHLRLVGERTSDRLPRQGRSEYAEPGTWGREDVAPTISPQLDCDPSAVVNVPPDRFGRGGAISRFPSPQRDDAVTEPDIFANPDPATSDPAQSVSFPPAADGGYRHECVLYSGIDGFLAMAVPFIVAGLDLHQQVLVAVAEPRLGALRRAIGEAASQVEFVDMAELGHNPARIIPAWREFAGRSGGLPLRGIGEPIWAGRRDAEIIESQLHEALLNIAVDQATPLWLICPYDIAELDKSVIDEAMRSHPFLGPGGPGDDHPHVGPHRAAEIVIPDDRAVFGGTDHLAALFAADLPEPTSPTAELPTGDPAALADNVLQVAATAGLTTAQSARLATAIGEIVLAGSCASGGQVRVRVWQDEAALVCEVGDDGLVVDPMIGRGTDFAAKSRDRGIRLANELCDLVQVRSGAGGTTVRVLSWL